MSPLDSYRIPLTFGRKKFLNGDSAVTVSWIWTIFFLELDGGDVFVVKLSK